MAVLLIAFIVILILAWAASMPGAEAIQRGYSPDEEDCTFCAGGNCDGSCLGAAPAVDDEADACGCHACVCVS